MYLGMHIGLLCRMQSTYLPDYYPARISCNSHSHVYIIYLKGGDLLITEILFRHVEQILFNLILENSKLTEAGEENCRNIITILESERETKARDSFSQRIRDSIKK